MSIDFLLRADSRAAFEAMAKSQGFMDEAGNPLPESLFDPTPGTPEYETGIPIRTNPQPSPFPTGEPAPLTLREGYYLNFRVWGALEEAQFADLPQTKEETGEVLPLRQRTTFGLWMTELGEEGEQQNLDTITTFVTVSGVSFLDPESIRTRQRVWQ